MSLPPANLAPALDRFRRGDLPGALSAVEAALVAEPDAPALLEFAGLVAAQMGDAPGAIPFFRRSLALAPDDQSARANLATALAAAGQYDEAEALCRAGGDDSKLGRLLAYIHQQQGRLAESEAAYVEVLSAFPGDFESWNNLGNVRSAQGDLDGAVTAFEQAITLRPDIVPIYINLSEVLANAERPQARQKVMRDAVRLAPRDASVQTELGLAETGAREFAAAERAFREAIRLSPGFTSAYLELGLLLENLNRIDELATLAEEAEARGVSGPELSFIKAWALRRQGRFEEALPYAEATPASINPVRRAQLVAEVNDRLGNADRAFAAFAEMNEAAVAAKPPPQERSYRAEVFASMALLTPSRIADWTPVVVDRSPPPPVFIVGFPRSGTTLLDTLLMNIAELHVLEEQPVLRQVQHTLGDEARLANLTSAEANALRAHYFETLEQIQPSPSGRTVIDKFPLHMTDMPLIHRIFPDAKVVLVERHPCDSVLSCYMSNFQLNRGMRSFTDLREAALTYDAVFEKWSRAVSLLPIDFHRIRYERMVENLESEMRPLLEFLDLPWDPKVLDNRGSAAQREHIRTASYSQVTEPIYRRSAGRWQRYRRQMEPVLPILEPWAQRMGYEM